jgi:Uma2 family endonuclease
MNVTTGPGLMTGDEFLARFGDEPGVELVKGRVVRYPMPGAEHGEVCGKATYWLTKHAMETDTGRVLANDTHIRTATDPDTFRGADVCFVGYARLAKDQPTPRGPLLLAPDVVVEVRSPSDRWGDIQIKIGEYTNIGVPVVIVLDPGLDVATVFRGEEIPQRFHNGDEFTLPDILPGFAVPVRRFFE